MRWNQGAITLTEPGYTVAIAREHHFRRTTEVCSVTRPALSLAVKKREDESGIALVECGKTEATVTPVGMRIIEQAHRMLEELVGVWPFTRLRHGPLAGPLHISAIDTLAPFIIQCLVPAPHTAAPDIPRRDHPVLGGLDVGRASDEPSADHMTQHMQPHEKNAWIPGRLP